MSRMKTLKGRGTRGCEAYSEPGTVEDPRHGAWRPSLCAKTARAPRLRSSHRHPCRALRAQDVVEPFEFPPEDLFVEEHDSAKRLIFGRSRYASLDRNVGQKALDLGFAHGVRMALPMEQDEPGLQGRNAFWEVQDEPGLQGCNASGSYRMNRDYRDVMLLGGTG